MGFFDDVGSQFTALGNRVTHNFATLGRGAKNTMKKAAGYFETAGAGLGAAALGAGASGIGAPFAPFLAGAATASEIVGGFLDGTSSLFDKAIEQDDKNSIERSRKDKEVQDKWREEHSFKKDKIISGSMGTIIGGKNNPANNPAVKVSSGVQPIGASTVNTSLNQRYGNNGIM